MLSVVGAAPALATVGEVLGSLRTGPLFVSAQSTVQPDRALVGAALAQSSTPTYVVVVSQAEADAVVDGVGAPDAIVLVLTDGQELQARGGAATGTVPADALDRVLGSRFDEPFRPDTLTSAIVNFVERVGSPEVVEQ